MAPLANFDGTAPGRPGFIRQETRLRRRGVIASGRVRPPALTLPDSLIPLLEMHLATLPAITATR